MHRIKIIVLAAAVLAAAVRVAEVNRPVVLAAMAGTLAAGLALFCLLLVMTGGGWRPRT